VHLDDDGTLGFRPDIYRRDAAVLAALNRHQPMAARDLVQP